ncbi:hypothetical protein N9043_01980 [bacterium]|nr:hypothetical protein [bacterium]
MENIIRVTYTSYSSILDKWFKNTKDVKSLSDFNMFANAIHSGSYEIQKVECLLSKTIQNAICKAYNVHLSFAGKRYIEDKTSEKLTEVLGLKTNDNQHDLGIAKINFCWKAEKWYIL